MQRAGCTKTKEKASCAATEEQARRRGTKMIRRDRENRGGVFKIDKNKRNKKSGEQKE